MFLKKQKGPIDVPGGLILLPMFAAHPYNHFCTEYPPPPGVVAPGIPQQYMYIGSFHVNSTSGLHLLWLFWILKYERNVTYGFCITTCPFY